MTLSEWLHENQYKFDLLEDGGEYGYGGEWFPSKDINIYAVEALIESYISQLKVWIYEPRSSQPEVHLRLETVLEDMADDIAYAEQEGEEWDFREDVYPSVYVDDGGRAHLVAVRP
jgi:hypothetical protein